MRMARSALSPSSPAGAGQIGPQGPPGSKGVTFKGLWAAQTNYEVGDIVHHPTADGQRVTYLALVDHTSLAGAPPAPGGTTEWWELGEAYLLLDGQREMTGDLSMNAATPNQITNILNLLLTGGVGAAIVDAVRTINMVGDEADAEARITAVRRVVFVADVLSSIIENLSAARFNVAVVPGTDTPHTEGQLQWSATEGLPQADINPDEDDEEIRHTLGWCEEIWEVVGV
jgi:hypothetical protein